MPGTQRSYLLKWPVSGFWTIFLLILIIETFPFCYMSLCRSASSPPASLRRFFFCTLCHYMAPFTAPDKNQGQNICLFWGRRGRETTLCKMSRMMRWVRPTVHRRHCARLQLTTKSSCLLLFHREKTRLRRSSWRTSRLFSPTAQSGWARAVSDHRIIDSGIWIHFRLSGKSHFRRNAFFCLLLTSPFPRRRTRCIGLMEVFSMHHKNYL